MKQRNQVPVILQMEAVECGAASLAMVLASFGRFVPLEKLRIDCNVTRDGSSAKYIAKAAVRHGLKTRAFKMSAEQLMEMTDFPVILHWNFNHFVVLCGFKKGKAIINDPAFGRVLTDMETVASSFTGIVLSFAKGESFEPCGKEENVFGFLKKHLFKMKGPLFFVVVLGIIYEFLHMMPPVFYKIYTDKILLGSSSEWLFPLLFAMGAAGLFALVVGGLKSMVLTRMKAKFSISASVSFFW